MMFGHISLALFAICSAAFFIYFQLMMLREIRKATGRRLMMKSLRFSRARILPFRPPKPIVEQDRPAA